MRGGSQDEPQEEPLSRKGRRATAPVGSFTDPYSASSSSTASLRETSDGKFVPDFTVRHEEKTEGYWKALFPAAAMTKMAGNALGMGLCAGGYMLGKAEMLVRGRSSDSMAESLAFRTGFKAWMWANGIVPTVTYAPGENAEDFRLTPLIVSNHVSYLDGLILSSVLEAPKILAKSDVKDIPVIGSLCEEIDTIFVERGDQSSKKAALEAIQTHIQDWEPGERPLLIFPEGTTSNGEGLMDFNKGAFIGGMPVRPVLLAYTGDWSAATYYKEIEGRVVETTDQEWAENFVGHFLHWLQVRVLPPYYPNNEEQQDPDLYAQQCRAYMLEALQDFRKELGLEGDELDRRKNAGVVERMQRLFGVGGHSQAEDDDATNHTERWKAIFGQYMGGQCVVPDRHEPVPQVPRRRATEPISRRSWADSLRTPTPEQAASAKSAGRKERRFRTKSLLLGTDDPDSKSRSDNPSDPMF